MKNELSRITIDISASTHQKLKALAAHKRVSMRKIIEELIELRLRTQDRQEECPYSHVPNKKLLKTIKDANAGKDVTEYKDVEDLFKKLGI